MHTMRKLWPTQEKRQSIKTVLGGKPNVELKDLKSPIINIFLKFKEAISNKLKSMRTTFHLIA